ncbi:unnamed protein product [Urochloa decumbens]|uniref:non-specific serine/threonine protein kinase n=1 Tax=Urochloa decumbens TaxID=240449 RepID=A0ABC9D887_9POAL
MVWPRLLSFLWFIIFGIAVAHLHSTAANITAPWEVHALKAVRGSLIDPQGYLGNWNGGDPCMENWSYVICYNTTARDGYLHLQELQLLQLNLEGTLAPELGQLSHMQTMDFMWNSISGCIPKELGNITSLNLLLLSGNQLNGTIPEEIGFLPNLSRIQIDQNLISGPIPKSFAHLNKIKYLLLDNNNLSGYLPSELSQLPKILIIQIDNNNFSGTSIPSSYGNITTLLKLSLRNCSLEGSVLDVSGIPQLGYLDLSWNHLRGPISVGRFAGSITTIDLSHNHLNGSIPGSFSGLPNLQILSLDNNNIDGSFPPNVWQNVDFINRTLILDFQNNSLSNLSNSLLPPANVTILYAFQFNHSLLHIIRLYGNPVCATQSQLNTSRYCQSTPVVVPDGYSHEKPICVPCPFGDIPYEANPVSPIPCFCAVPLNVNYELTSPIFWDFLPYQVQFQNYLSSELSLSQYQIDKGGRSRGATIGIIMAAFVAAAILLLLFTIIIRRRRSSKKRYDRRIPMKIDGVKDFTFRQLSHGTNDFSESAAIGRGGYGKVYRGVLADGTIVAVKRAQKGSLQGSKEFFTEIELLSRLHHRNLVPLLGYCDEQDEQMLVYEFMPNGTLREHLSVRTKEPLDFPARLRIALGSSRGILYLHTEADPPIFHRDIKASNILLDSKWVAKVADFGLSRLAPVPEIEGSAPGHASTVVKGTPV